MDDRPYATGPDLSNMNAMTTTPAPISLASASRRLQARRIERAIAARRELSGEPAGRAWINGREVGGTDTRYLHLAASYD